MNLQVSAKPSGQKPRDNFNLKMTTPDGIRAFDGPRVFRMKLHVSPCIATAGSTPHLASWKFKKVWAVIIAGLQVTARRPCWGSRTKALLSAGK